MKPRLQIAIVLAAGLYLFQSSPVWACFCTGGEPQLIAAYKSTAAVFLGTVTALRRTVIAGGAGDSDQILVAYLDVEEAFKGVTAKQIAVLTDANHAGGCGFHFEVGTQYLVFAAPPPGSLELQVGFTPARGISIPVPMRAPTLATGACSRSGAKPYQRGALVMIRNFVQGTSRPQIDGLVGVNRYEFDGSFIRELRPISDLVVVATANGQRFETRTDEVGSFIFSNLPKGKYTVSAQFPAPYPPAIQTAELASNEHRAQLFLTATPSARVRGRLVDFEGRPLETSVAVSLIPVAAASTPDSLVNSWTQLFSGGRFEFREVPPGNYLLGISPVVPTPNAPYARTFYPRGASVDEAEILEVSRDVIDNLVLKLPPELETRQISGVAVTANGTPLSDAQVLLYDLEMPSRLAATVRFTDGAGRFKLFGVKGRRYLLQARTFTDFTDLKGIQSQRLEVTVGETPQAVTLLVDQEANLAPQLR